MMASKCEKCGKTDSYNFQLNIGLCNLCIMEEFNRLQSENEKLKQLIDKYGTDDSKFDWGVLQTIDELETALEIKDKQIEAIKTAIEVINQALKETKE